MSNKITDKAKKEERIIRSQRCLFDDGAFMVAARNRSEIIRDIVRRVFTKAGIAFSDISEPEIQKRITDSSFREVIYDCYAECPDGSRIAVEVQNESSGFSHMREAFYLAELRIYKEKKGTDYESMAPVYLIILHRHNPYAKEGHNLPVYKKGCYIKDTDITYSDGMCVLRVNGDYTEKGDVLGDLMSSLKAARPEDAVLDLYRETLKDLERHDMKYTFKDLLRETHEEALAEGIEIGEVKGKKEGRAETQAEIIANLKSLGISDDIINRVIPQRSL